MRVRGGGEEGMRMCVCVCCVHACVYAGGREGQMEEEGVGVGVLVPLFYHYISKE